MDIVGRARKRGVPMVVHAGKHDLGESPVWCWRSGQLYWTNIRARQIHAYDPATRRTHTIPAPDMVAAVGLHKCGGLIVGMTTCIAHCDPETGAFEPLVDVEPAARGNRGNDGRVDRHGRFWFGTMSNTERTPVGALYLYDGTTIRTIRTGIIVPNALCWSLDAATMYFADSWVGEIEVWSRTDAGDYAKSGHLLDQGRLPGIPDGAIVDSEGCLWNARYGGGQVARIGPDGTVRQVISLPTAQVTSCALGGDDLRTLFVTSATQRMSAEERLAEPDAGALFAIEVAVPGVPEPEFAPGG